MKNVFIDPVLDKEFARNGFVIVKGFDTAVCEELLAKHKSLEPGVDDKFYASQNSLNYEYRKSVEDILHPVFEERIGSIVTDRTVLYTQYMTKRPGIKGECNMHQDWTFVREPDQFAINFWCALEDVNEANGCIRVMPGSHRLKNYHRGRNINQSTIKEEKFISKWLMSPVILKKGEAVLFHSRLVHESQNNLSQKDRIAAAAMLVPIGSQPIHYMRSAPEDDMVTEMNVDSSFFIDHSCRTMPDGHNTIGTFASRQKYFGKTELLSVWLASKLK